MSSLTRLFAARSIRSLHTSTTLRTSTGYGDPPEEKAQNHTPTPSSTPDPKQGNRTGTTDPEVAQKTGNQPGTSKDGDDQPSGQTIRETKKVGEKPKKE